MLYQDSKRAYHVSIIINSDEKRYLGRYTAPSVEQAQVSATLQHGRYLDNLREQDKTFVFHTQIDTTTPIVK